MTIIVVFLDIIINCIIGMYWKEPFIVPLHFTHLLQVVIIDFTDTRRCLMKDTVTYYEVVKSIRYVSLFTEYNVIQKKLSFLPNIS